ncbi:MAG: hypothetical protein ACKO7W_01410 [Elainella sp.]
MNQAAERVESLKAGLVGALAATGVFWAGVALSRLYQPWLDGIISQAGSGASTSFLQELIDLPSFDLLFQSGVALLSGFLFGVTYRYVVRNDRNSHLQSGAVLAFGLVRGLAQVDLSDAYGLAGFKIVESLLLFGMAAWLLDRLMQRGWLKQFD